MKWPWLRLCLPQTPWSRVSRNKSKTLSPESPSVFVALLEPGHCSREREQRQDTPPHTANRPRGWVQQAGTSRGWTLGLGHRVRPAGGGRDRGFPGCLQTVTFRVTVPSSAFPGLILCIKPSAPTSAPARPGSTPPLAGAPTPGATGAAARAEEPAQGRSRRDRAPGDWPRSGRGHSPSGWRSFPGAPAER